ncbi:hypothetical protein BK009_03435 [Methanobacterium subterraneum]|uniref:Uncharacterized protein n=1 Tax=Methanobacterium subterraneum TaxID=59277 RepID=A0A2H4VP27_9EURY|nr:tetratricopeptide repeat protein [Methanobacterium subterraneum]AUB59810.1 hypothetical protein BK009_03435 [Methanobacterium subterraneum]
MKNSWKTVKIFISSTFKDMQAERDHLVRFVFPRLREDLIKYKIYLIDVDLRWGITSDQDAYDVCMDEIDNCHPYFMCMLGGRYGWIPPEKKISITESEIYYGALDKLDIPTFRFFYLRDAKITNSIPAEFNDDYKELKDSESEKQLKYLKEKIMNPEIKGKVLIKPDEVECKSLSYFIYPCKWDNNLKRIVDLESFGNQVYNDIMSSINVELGLGEIISSNEFDDEKVAIDSFLNKKTENYVVGSRKNIIDTLKNFTENKKVNGYLIIYGEPGIGKTSIMAKFYEEYVTNHPNELILPLFVGSTIRSTDPQQVLRRFSYELYKVIGYDGEITENYGELKNNFYSILFQASNVKPIVILIDGINQINHIDNLRWLPDKLPNNVHILISTMSGPTLELLRKQKISQELYLPPLESSDTEIIIDEFLNRYRKMFDQKQKKALMNKKNSNNPLYLLMALEELRTLGHYNEITDTISKLPETVKSLFKWILKRLENDDGFRDDEGNLVGSKIIPEFSSLVAVSRQGLLENELVDLIDPTDPKGNIAALMRLLRPYLMYVDNLVFFYHRELLEAVNELYLPNNNLKNNSRLKLADYFESRELDDRRIDELPYQLDKAESWQRLKKSIVDLEMFINMIKKSKKFELFYYWHHIKTKYNMVDEYKKALEKHEKNTTEEEIGGYYLQVADFVAENAYFDGAEFLFRRALEINENAFGPDHSSIGTILNNLSLVLQSKGDLNGAELVLRRSIEIHEKIYGPENSETASCINNLALVLHSRGDLSGAERLYKQVLQIKKKCLGIEHSETANILNNLADLLQDKKDLDGAESLHRQALNIRRRIFGSEHTDTANSLNNLAMVLQAKGNLNAAEPLLKRALKINQKFLGPDHPQTSINLNNMAMLLQDKGDVDAAIPLFAQALENSTKVLGQNHPNSCNIRYNLDRLILKNYRDLGD